MQKRERFLKQLRDDAKVRGLEYQLLLGRGKGGHAMVLLGDRLTTIPARDIDPKTARKIRKALGLD